MTDDIEGEVQEAPEAPAPEPEAPSPPGDELSSDIRKAVDTQRERGPDGKFVKSESGPAKAAKGIATGGTDTGRPQEGPREAAKPASSGDAPEPAGTSPRPPPGFSVATKQAWDALPDHVKADIAKRESEVDAGFKRYGGLGKFAEEAEKNGTTLQAAVADYVGVETELRKDFVSGVEFLCRRLQVDPRALMHGLAQRYGVPTTPPNGQDQAPQQRQQQIDPAAIATYAANMVRSELQQKEINSDIAAFSANPANRFFGNVRMDMSQLVQAGKASNLQEAYEAACWLNPEIRAILIEETAAGRNKQAVATAVKAQNAAKAVTGAPSNANAGATPQKRSNLSLDDEIRAAINAQRA